MDLVPAIEEMIAAVPSETEGQVKPELIQSVLEISTDVAAAPGRPRASSRSCAAACARPPSPRP